MNVTKNLIDIIPIFDMISRYCPYMGWKQKLVLYDEIRSGMKLKCQNGHFISIYRCGDEGKTDPD